MTTREYFRQLRAEQFAVDPAFFQRMAEILPRHGQIHLDVEFRVCEGRVVEQQTLDALYQLALVMYWGERHARFLAFHKAVCYGEVRLAPMVAPSQVLFPPRTIATYGELAADLLARPRWQWR